LGRGFQVTVSSPQASGYALVAFGLGQLDLRDYKNLCIWSKAMERKAKFVAYLKDGVRRRDKPVVGHMVQVSPVWERHCIPLTAFDKRLRHYQIKQLVFAWEDRVINQHRLVFDEIVFE
jgi:hypothetical protein